MIILVVIVVANGIVGTADCDSLGRKELTRVDLRGCIASDERNTFNGFRELIENATFVERF